MNFESPLVDLVIALGLGLLVGLQRESQARSAGLRTFALVTLGGAVAGLLVPSAGGWVVGSGLLAVAILGAIDHFNEREKGSGLTTEAAMIAMYLVGVVVTVIDERLAVVLAGTVAVLLQAKGRFRRVMEKLGDGDVRAIMQFVLLSLVILPVLPNRDYGPWGVLNPFEIWLLVVLIVGINLGGYIAWKFVRADTGVLLTGALGALSETLSHVVERVGDRVVERFQEFLQVGYAHADPSTPGKAKALPGPADRSPSAFAALSSLDRRRRSPLPVRSVTCRRKTLRARSSRL